LKKSPAFGRLTAADLGKLEIRKKVKLAHKPAYETGNACIKDENTS
jgi:hypothetical protein